MLQRLVLHQQHVGRVQWLTKVAGHLPTKLLAWPCSSFSSDTSATTKGTTSSALHAVLEDAGFLSFPAIMSVMKHSVVGRSSNSNLDTATVATKLQRLNESMGPQLLNQMLTKEPALLLERRPEALFQHYQDLRSVLQGDDELARHIVSRLPDILNHRSTAVATRIAEQSAAFQVSERQFMQLAAKAPSLLKLTPRRVTRGVTCLQQLTGLSPPAVFKTYLRWPLMATTTPELLERRHQMLQQLLQASQSDMQRICAASPSLLVRDPAQLRDKLERYAGLLQLPLAEVLSIVRRQPLLLDWNTNTIVNRVTVICQTLRLTTEQRVQLLQSNNALLVHCADIPQRVDHLKRLLGLQEPELLPLLHNSLSVLRLTPDLMDAKLACASSLALLHPGWTAELQAMGPQHKLRMLSTASAHWWRLVYLMHSGQQDCSTVKAALHASAANFERAYPEFSGWLDRYNNAVLGQQGIPLVPQFLLHSNNNTADSDTTAAPPSAATYAPVPLNSSSSGSGASSAAHDAEEEGQPEASTTPVSADVSSSSSNAGPSQQPASAVLPPSPADMLAAWWGIGVADAQQLLSQVGRSLRWHQWQQRLVALQELLDVLGWAQERQPPDQAVSTVHSSSSSSSSSSSTSGTASSRSRRRISRARSRSSVSVESAAAHVGSPLLPSAADSVDSQQQPQIPEQQQHQHQHQDQQQLDGLQLLPEARQALQHALASGHAAAVACVSVACHLAPFNQQLHQLPPKPPDAAVQFALQHPSVVSRVAFVADCRRLAAMAAANQHLKLSLQQMGPAGLAKCLSAPASAIMQLQYLVQTQQPTPWAFGVSQLLCQQSWAVGTGRGSAGRRAAFVAAYPGFEAYEAAMQRL